MAVDHTNEPEENAPEEDVETARSEEEQESAEPPRAPLAETVRHALDASKDRVRTEQ